MADDDTTLISLKKKAKDKKTLGMRKAPKLIIGDAEEENPGQIGVQEQIIPLSGAGVRGGQEGVTIGRRPMANRSTGPGVTAGMGRRGSQRH